LSQLTQKVIVNATGYGARALWNDESIVPVRGQIAWLIPQPEVNYGVMYKNVNILARRDGIVVQEYSNEMEGYNDANEVPDRAAAEAAVQVVAELYERMGRTNGKSESRPLRAGIVGSANQRPDDGDARRVIPG
jgi:glycine/D-amino acid oxidase-like deaminating enzyme